MLRRSLSLAAARGPPALAIRLAPARSVAATAVPQPRIHRDEPSQRPMQRRSFTSATAASASASHTRSYDLVGRTAIVTGGRTGLGSAIVHLLVEQGVRVVVASRRAGEDAAASEKDARIIPILCDVRDPKQVEQMVETANRALGGIDIVVHAAGVNADALIVRATDANIESQIATNLVGAIYLARSTAQRMISQRTPASPSAAQEDTSATSAASSAPSSQPRGGRLIFISSVIGLSGNSGQSVYAASKSGLHGLTLSLAKELASRRITVNCVCPGYVETEMTRSMPEQARQKILDKLPSGRMGTGEDVAHTVAHLCSPQANHVTGQIIAIAGGLQI